MQRIPNLDPLRFILASLVVIFHVPIVSRTVGMPYWNDSPIFHRGFVAVFVFFTLSGFLITFLLLKEKQKTGTVSIRKFYIRRMLRIWPVYYLVLIFGLIYYNVLLPLLNVEFPVDYSILEALFLNVFFLPNVFGKWYDIGSILIVMWSIGIEEQFYLLWGPLSKYLPQHHFARFLAGFAVVYGIVFWFSPLSPVLFKYQMYFYYFAVGGLFATLALNNRVNYDRMIFHPGAQVAILVVFVLYFTTDIFLNAMPLWAVRLLDPFLFSYMILNFGFNPRMLFAIESRVLNYLGQISYGIYMYHMIALNFVLFLFLQFRWDMSLGNTASVVAINLLTFALTIIGSAVSYKYMEQYFLGLKAKFRVMKSRG